MFEQESYGGEDEHGELVSSDEVETEIQDEI